MAQQFRIEVVVDPSGARQGVQATNRELEKVESAASRVGAVLRRALSFAAAGALATSAVRSFAAYEQGLVGVGKTANLAGAELAALGGDILSLSTRLPVAQRELLAIAQAAGQLGVTGAANILRYTETVAQLGTASDLAGDQAASTLARLQNVTGETADTVNVLASVIVRLGNEFAATESEIAGVGTRVAQATAAFDVSSAQAVGLGAAIKALGVEAELAGTEVGRGFRAIEGAVRAGGDQLERFAAVAGTSAEEFAAAFQSSNVAGFQRFIEGLGRIRAEGGSVAATLAQLGFDGERSAAVYGSLATRADLVAAALATAQDELTVVNALTTEAARGADTLTGDWGRLINAARALAAGIGTGGVGGALRVVVQTGADVLRVFGGVDEGFQRSRETAEALAGAIQSGATALAIYAGGLGALRFADFIAGNVAAAQAVFTAAAAERAKVAGLVQSTAAELANTQALIASEVAQLRVTRANLAHNYALAASVPILEARLAGIASEIALDNQLAALDARRLATSAALEAAEARLAAASGAAAAAKTGLAAASRTLIGFLTSPTGLVVGIGAVVFALTTLETASERARRVLDEMTLSADEAADALGAYRAAFAATVDARSSGDLARQRTALLGVVDAIELGIERIQELQEERGAGALVELAVAADLTGIDESRLRAQIAERLGGALELELSLGGGVSEDLARQVNAVLERLPRVSDELVKRLQFANTQTQGFFQLEGLREGEAQAAATGEALERLARSTGSAQQAIEELLAAGGVRAAPSNELIEAARREQAQWVDSLKATEEQAARTGDALSTAGGGFTAFSEEVVKGRESLAGYLDDLRRETELVGVSAQERERAIALRDVERLAVEAGILPQERLAETILAGVTSRDELEGALGRLLDQYEAATRAAEADERAQQRAQQAADARAGALRSLQAQLVGSFARSAQLADELAGLSEIERERAEALRQASQSAFQAGASLQAVAAFTAVAAQLERVVDLREQLAAQGARDRAGDYLAALADETRLEGLLADQREEAEAVRRAQASATGLASDELETFLALVRDETRATQAARQAREAATQAQRAQAESYGALAAELVALELDAARLDQQLAGLTERQIGAGETLRAALDAAASAGGGPAALALLSALAAQLGEVEARAAALADQTRQADLLERITGGQAELAQVQSDLNALLEQGAISAERYASAMRQVDAASARAEGTISGGFRAGLLEVQERLADVSGAAEAVVVRGFGAAEDAIAEFAVTGELNVSRMVDGIISDLARLLLRQALGGLLGLAGGGGGLLDGLLGGARAKGGDVKQNTPYLVGEKGPEIVIPSTSGVVIPADRTAAFLAGAARATGQRGGTGLDRPALAAEGGAGLSGGALGAALRTASLGEVLDALGLPVAGQRKGGGSVHAGQPYLVGEDGPELLMGRSPISTPVGGGSFVPDGRAASSFSGLARPAAAPVVTVAPAPAPIVQTYIVEDESRVVAAIEGPRGEQAILNVVRRNRDAIASF